MTPGFWLIVALVVVTIVAPSLIWLTDRCADAYDALTARRAREVAEDAAVFDGCTCQIVGWSRDPYEPHIPAQAEWEQADACPVHPLVPNERPTQ